MSCGDIVSLALSYGCDGIAYMYNQPTIFIEFARDIGLEVHKRGLTNIFVTNGYDTPETIDMMGELLDCVTVDFKGNREIDFLRKYVGIRDNSSFRQEMRDKTKIHIENYRLSHSTNQR